MSDLAGAAINGVYGVINNMWADKHTSKDRWWNHLYNEIAANNADTRTRALYNDFYSPQALMQQYLEAGLSPSLMFGGTPGQGGMSGAQGAGGAGLQTPFYGISALEAAQISNLQAQTKKTEAETETIEGTNERGYAEIQQVLKQTGKIEAETVYQNLVNQWQEIENYVQTNTADLRIEELEEQVDVLEWTAKNMKYQAKLNRLEFDVQSQTAADRVRMVHEQVGNIIADTALKVAGKNLAEEQIKEVRAHINYMNKMLEIETSHLNNEYFMLDYQRMQIEANKKYQEEMIKYLKESLHVGDNNADWDRVTNVITRVVSAAGQIAMMYYLRGASSAAKMTGTPVTGQGIPYGSGGGYTKWY